MRKEITVELGQTLVDIAIQELGSSEGLIDILAANPTIEQADELTPGTVLVIDSELINVAVADYFDTNQIKVATATQFTDKTGVYELETYESATYQKQ